MGVNLISSTCWNDAVARGVYQSSSIPSKVSSMTTKEQVGDILRCILFSVKIATTFSAKLCATLCDKSTIPFNSKAAAANLKRTSSFATYFVSVLS